MRNWQREPDLRLLMYALQYPNVRAFFMLPPLNTPLPPLKTPLWFWEA